MSQYVNLEGQALSWTTMGLVRPVMSNSSMKGIKSLDWHIKRAKKKKILQQQGCIPNLLTGEACVPSDLEID